MKALFQSWDPALKKSRSTGSNGPEGAVVVVVEGTDDVVGSTDAPPGSARRLVVVSCSGGGVDDPSSGDTVVEQADTARASPTTVAVIDLRFAIRGGDAANRTTG
jgi:hypothetical protein